MVRNSEITFFHIESQLATVLRNEFILDFMKLQSEAELNKTHSFCLRRKLDYVRIEDVMTA